MHLLLQVLAEGVEDILGLSLEVFFLLFPVVVFEEFEYLQLVFLLDLSFLHVLQDLVFFSLVVRFLLGFLLEDTSDDVYRLNRDFSVFREKGIKNYFFFTSHK